MGRQPYQLSRLALVAAACWLQCASAGAMNLLEAYETALKQDSTTRAARAYADMGNERVEQAKAQLYPNVSLNAGYVRNDLHLTQTSVSGNANTVNEKYPSHNAAIVVRQPLYRKALTVGLEQARRQSDEADAMLDKETQNLSSRVTEAYMQTLLAIDQLSLIAAQKRATTTQLDAARKLLAAGSGTRTDIDEAQARLDMAVALELEARQQQGFAQRQLAL